MSGDNMRAQCSDPIVRSDLDVGGESYLSGRCFYASLVAWASTRIGHDLMIVAGVKEDYTLMTNMCSALFLGFAAAASLPWAMAVLNLFYVPTGPNCGCYYQ